MTANAEAAQELAASSDADILLLEGLSKRFGDIVPADAIDLAIPRGTFFTLLGPSGSGKSTILRIVAGLEAPDAGRVYIDGQDVTGVPPWRRHLGMVFQQYANFPHLDVAANVAYGLRRGNLDKTAVAARVTELLDLVGLQGFHRRRVTQLSGGEQQRVAIARALAPRPTLLLLDEPLSALDEKIRREMQGELRAIQQRTGTTFIYVTHDQEEALTMSDRIAVLNRGRVAQCDGPEAIFRRPRTAFVARFFRGSNVLEVQASPDAGTMAVTLANQALRLSERPAAAGTHLVALRGEQIRLGAAAADSQLRLPAVLEKITYRGLYSDYRLRLADGQTLSAAAPHRHDLQEGEALEIGLAEADLVLLEAE